MTHSVAFARRRARRPNRNLRVEPLETRLALSSQAVVATPSLSPSAALYPDGLNDADPMVRAAIAGVMIAGRKVMWDRKIGTIDESRLRRQAEEASERMIRSNSEARSLTEALERFVGTFCVAQSRRIATCGVCGSTH